ncbi:ABC transporter permease [Lacisediminihabitans profunda]|uniref:ABC transporter permease n=2 Tax=Lacisediminihabitans profunda TaxID=2594790 RepID=A0A5C8URA0_9MICO|nr:ABC transporter permease [Lacisediminihabitans profunda]
MTMTRPRLRQGPRGGGNWLLLIPAIALLAIVLGVPLVENVVRSFQTPFGTTGVTFDNYVRIFTVPSTLTILLRTLIAAIIVTVVALVFGYPYAYLMTRVGPRARGLMLTIVLIPFWTSALARNFAWIILLGNHAPVQQFFAFFGNPNVVLYGTAGGVILAMSQVLLPFMVLPLYASLGGIDRRLLLAARGLGSSPLVAFWRIYWPLSRTGVASGLILVFTLACGFYVTPALVGSPQQSLVAQLLGQETNQLLDFAGAGALGTFILIVTLALVAWANRVGGSINAIGAVSVEGRK